jgi:hypothetical protein
MTRSLYSSGRPGIYSSIALTILHHRRRQSKACLESRINEIGEYAESAIAHTRSHPLEYFRMQ